MSTTGFSDSIVQLTDSLFSEKEVCVYMKLLNLEDPFINGNKIYKLKYNISEAKKTRHNTLLTFGGAYSNHIAATAAVGKKEGLKTIGIIRGTEAELKNNPTLMQAFANGMLLDFVDREKYRQKNNEDFVNGLRKKHGEFYLIPEGGSNLLGVMGCMEIIGEGQRTRGKGHGAFDIICCSCGTGATLAGIVLSLNADQKTLGFAALKGGEFLKKDVEGFIDAYEKYALRSTHVSGGEFQIVADYHFGGYGKVNNELMEFVKGFKDQHDIQLDYVYTAKMMYGLTDLIKKGNFKPGTGILAIHTGGLQGNQGYTNKQ